MKNYSVPFVSNAPDDKHCLQASYAMIRQYFEPDLEIDWQEWSDLTGFVPDKATQATAGLLWFMEHDYEVVHMSLFDYRRFASEGGTYMLEALGERIAKWEIELMADMSLEQIRAFWLAQSGNWVQRTPTLDDIYSFLDNGYLLRALVNMRALNDEQGYHGHAVVVKGYTENEIIVHDPGLPARPDRHVPIPTFLSAWINQETHSEKLDAIRKVSPIAAALPSHDSAEVTENTELALT
jgi:hypothetical protein